ncbi:MAG: hypothetical protein L0216_11835 [Planctomycetales bacterium]|nr:hypothetical protein [Planctomycetales bacterium]
MLCKNLDGGPLSEPKVIEAAKPFIPIRVDQAKDQAIWQRYDVQGVGYFIVLNNEGEFFSDVSNQDLRPKAMTAAFLKTLGESWEKLKGWVKPVPFEETPAKAAERAKAEGKPLALVFVKADPAGAAQLEALAAPAVARRWEKFVWAKLEWKAPPAEAKTYGVLKTPTLVLAGPDGAKVELKSGLVPADALAPILDKVAAKFPPPKREPEKRAEAGAAGAR